MKKFIQIFCISSCLVILMSWPRSIYAQSMSLEEKLYNIALLYFETEADISTYINGLLASTTGLDFDQQAELRTAFNYYTIFPENINSNAIDNAIYALENYDLGGVTQETLGQVLTFACKQNLCSATQLSTSASLIEVTINDEDLLAFWQHEVESIDVSSKTLKFYKLSNDIATAITTTNSESDRSDALASLLNYAKNESIYDLAFYSQIAQQNASILKNRHIEPLIKRYYRPLWRDFYSDLANLEQEFDSAIIESADTCDYCDADLVTYIKSLSDPNQQVDLISYFTTAGYDIDGLSQKLSYMAYDGGSTSRHAKKWLVELLSPICSDIDSWSASPNADPILEFCPVVNKSSSGSTSYITFVDSSLPTIFLAAHYDNIWSSQTPSAIPASIDLQAATLGNNVMSQSYLIGVLIGTEFAVDYPYSVYSSSEAILRDVNILGCDSDTFIDALTSHCEGLYVLLEQMYEPMLRSIKLLDTLPTLADENINLIGLFSSFAMATIMAKIDQDITGNSLRSKIEAIAQAVGKTSNPLPSLDPYSHNLFTEYYCNLAETYNNHKFSTKFVEMIHEAKVQVIRTAFILHRLNYLEANGTSCSDSDPFLWERCFDEYTDFSQNVREETGNTDDLGGLTCNSKISLDKIIVLLDYNATIYAAYEGYEDPFHMKGNQINWLNLVADSGYGFPSVENPY